MALVAVSGCSDAREAHGDSPDARLIKVVGRHNIVAFAGKVYGAPHGIEIDWKRDDFRKVRGLLVGDSIAAVEKAVKSLPPEAADPRLLKAVGRYNIVEFAGKVYGAPHGVDIDWSKHDLKAIPGLIAGSSAIGVELSVRGRLVGERVARLASPLSRLSGRKP